MKIYNLPIKKSIVEFIFIIIDRIILNLKCRVCQRVINLLARAKRTQQDLYLINWCVLIKNYH